MRFNILISTALLLSSFAIGAPVDLSARSDEQLEDISARGRSFRSALLGLPSREPSGPFRNFDGGVVKYIRQLVRQGK
jgi:hypothetical protein